MAKKAFLKDHDDIEILPITRGELVLDSSGNPAFSSNEFLATTSQPGLMSAEDKYKITNMQASSVANALTLKINGGSAEGTNLYTFNGSVAKTLNIVAGSNVTLTPSANTLTIAANLPDIIDAYTKTESDNRYLKLDGGYMNVNASINFKHYSASVGGGGWAHAGIGFYDRSGDIRFGGLSAHGNDDKLVYIYLGTNAYNGLNLRIDSKSISWGDNHLLHLGSTTCPIVFDQNYTNNTDADTLIRAGFYINTTGNGSGNSHFPKGEGYGRLFSWGDQYARVQMYAGTENGALYFRSGSYSLVDKEWKRIAFDTSTVASAYKLITGSGTAVPNIEFANASGNNIVFGYDTAKSGYDTYLAGRNITLRIFSGETNKGGIVINNYANVTIGDADYAGNSSKLFVNGKVLATSFAGNLDGQYINALTNYTKSTSISALADTDTLNAALGKLEYKADVAYNLVKGAYDGDGTIENLAEILKVLEGISDTETIKAIIGKYLPLTGGTLTGNISAPAYLLGNGNGTYIDSGADNTLIFYDNTARRTVIHSGNISQQNVAGANKLISQYVGDLNGAEADRFFTSGFQASNRPSHHNYATGISLYNSELKYKYQLTFDTYGTLYTRYLNSSNTWSEWNQIAGIVNIPTLISQLTDDLGLIHTGNIQNQTVLAAKQLAGLYVGDNADANSFYHTSESVIKFRTAIGNNSTNFPVFASWQNALLEIGLHSNGSTAQFYFSKDNPLYYRSNYTNAWQQIAYISDIPTKLSQLTNDLGFVTGGPYLPLTGGTIRNGATRNPLTIDTTNTGGYINFALNGTNGAFVGYNNSSGAFIETADGATLLLKGSNITFNSNKVWHAGNDGANSGLDADLLDGNHASAFVLDSNFASKELNSNLTTITKSITLTKDWQDTGIVINETNFPGGAGTYAIQVFVADGNQNFWNSYFSGIMSMYTYATNAEVPDDEILLHHASHACAKQIYLKTKPTLGGSGYYNKLYIACNTNCSSAISIVFKFKKLI